MVATQPTIETGKVDSAFYMHTIHADMYVTIIVVCLYTKVHKQTEI